MPFLKEFKSFPILTTSRLILRNFRVEDGEAYMRMNVDPDVQRYMGQVKHPITPDEMRRWVANMNGHYFSKAKITICWAMETQAKEFLGRIELAHFVRRSMADLSYHSDKRFWNNGYMTEAIGAVLKFAWERLELHRIQATVHPENVASLRVLTKNGFRQEGLLQKENFGNEFRDTIIMAVLREDLL